MIHIHGLRKAYGARNVLGGRVLGGRVLGGRVLGGLSAHVPEGSVVALAGASGAGKSTLLRCLNGLEPFDAGAIEIAGHRLSPGASGVALARALGAGSR